MNDVVLAAVTSALRRERPRAGPSERWGSRPLVAAVPISVRPADLERGFGNHTSAMMVPLPTHIDDLIDRPRAIHDVAGHTKQHHGRGYGLFERWAGLVPAWAI